MTIMTVTVTTMTVMMMVTMVMVLMHQYGEKPAEDQMHNKLLQNVRPAKIIN